MSDSLPSWARRSADGLSITLTLHVQPNARANQFAGPHGDALKVRIAAPPADHRANQALLDFLRESLGVPRSALRIVQGHTARRKIVAIGADCRQVANRIRLWDEEAR